MRPGMRQANPLTPVSADTQRIEESPMIARGKSADPRLSGYEFYREDGQPRRAVPAIRYPLTTIGGLSTQRIPARMGFSDGCQGSERALTTVLNGMVNVLVERKLVLRDGAGRSHSQKMLAAKRAKRERNRREQP